MSLKEEVVLMDLLDLIKDLIESILQEPSNLINLLAVITNIIVILVAISSKSRGGKLRIGCAGFFTIAFFAIIFGFIAVFNYFGGGGTGFIYAVWYVFLALLFFMGLQRAREQDEEED